MGLRDDRLSIRLRAPRRTLHALLRQRLRPRWLRPRRAGAVAMTTMAETPTLVFPGGMPESLAYAAEASRRGESLVGASSVANDPAAAAYSRWTHLPFVHEPGFAQEFQRVVSELGIARVFCAHQVIRPHLEKMLSSLGCDVTLVRPAPQARTIGRDVSAAYATLLSGLPAPRVTTDLLSELELTAMLDRALA